MKILVVTNMYRGSNRASPWQGVFVTEQVDALRRSGDCSVDVLVIEGYRDKGEYLRSIGQVWKAARRGRYDVVHYHFGLSAEISARLRGLHRRVETIPCAVDETVFVARHDDTRAEPAVPIVVFPSSPKRPEKNYRLFAQVLRQLSEQHGIQVQERHIDGLDRGEVRDLLAGAACLLMTSTREGSPQSVKEAMAVGLPVVSVDVGNVRQLLDGVSPGMVVFDHDAGRLTNELADVLTAGARSNGRERLAALGCLSADVSTKLKALYASLRTPRRFARDLPATEKPDHEATR
ncbi:glycosyltransferase [Burkholderia sola]|uniref:glycosyltransferase n=1 Tax=Burkholderia sola TaxID=2843302 RepID=UPI00338D9A27